jgi:catechol 2,3-dioxygenase-like lactoylglutathione lyase family enzyme
MVATGPQDGNIESIGIGVLKVSELTSEWQSAGGLIDNITRHTARVRDPWGVPFELIECTQIGYTHINIASTSPQKLCDWYETNLGGTRMICEWDDSRFMLVYDTMNIMFISPTSAIFSTPERVIDHLGWYTDDLDATFRRLSTKNVHFPVMPRDFGPVRLAFAEDPCGNWIELLEPPNGIIRKPT